MHPGKFCNTSLGNLTIADCHAGFVCVEGSSSPEPVASKEGLIYEQYVSDILENILVFKFKGSLPENFNHLET